MRIASAICGTARLNTSRNRGSSKWRSPTILGRVGVVSGTSAWLNGRQLSLAAVATASCRVPNAARGASSANCLPDEGICNLSTDKVESLSGRRARSAWTRQLYAAPISSSNSVPH